MSFSSNSELNTIQLELHIGYVYGDKSYPANASNYTPKYCPGARLPHTWIRSTLISQPPVDLSYIQELSETDLAKKQFSTLDLCAFDAFTLILGPTDNTLAEHLRASFDGYALKINAVYLNKDFEVIDGIEGKKWIDEFGLESGSGVLVRPDQHILRTVHKDTALDEVVETLADHLGLDVSRA